MAPIDIFDTFPTHICLSAIGLGQLLHFDLGYWSTPGVLMDVIGRQNIQIVKLSHVSMRLGPTKVDFHKVNRLSRDHRPTGPDVHPVCCKNESSIVTVIGGCLS